MQGYVDKILGSQESDANFSGWFDRRDGGSFWHFTDEASVITALIEYTKIQPLDSSRISKIQTAVASYLDFKVAAASTSPNPYSVPVIYYRNGSGIWSTRFFEPTDDLTAPDELPANFNQGLTGRLASLAYAGFAAEAFLGTTTYSAFALRQVDWIWGDNPVNGSIQQDLVFSA